MCGNGVVEGETCDGNCACGQESDACWTTGSPGNCDLRWHQPVQACTSGDGCCAFDGGGGCSAGNDAECVGPGWQPLPLREVTYASLQQCDVVRVAIDPEGTYMFTTCSPGGGGSGDPRVTQVVDASGAPYAVTSDDCGDLTALPHLAGWQCANDQGALRHFCASPTPGGFRPSGPNAGYLELTVCPYSGSLGSTGPLSPPTV